jgi:hypothetical protein
MSYRIAYISLSKKSKRMRERIWRREQKDERKGVRGSGKREKSGKGDESGKRDERKREGEVNKRTQEEKRKTLPNR